MNLLESPHKKQTEQLVKKIKNLGSTFVTKLGNKIQAPAITMCLGIYMGGSRGRPQAIDGPEKL